MIPQVQGADTGTLNVGVWPGQDCGPSEVPMRGYWKGCLQSVYLQQPFGEEGKRGSDDVARNPSVDFKIKVRVAPPRFVTDKTILLPESGMTTRSSLKLDAAEEAVARSIYLLSDKGKQFQICQSHHLLGNIYRHKGEKEGRSPFRGITQNSIPSQLAYSVVLGPFRPILPCCCCFTMKVRLMMRAPSSNEPCRTGWTGILPGSYDGVVGSNLASTRKDVGLARELNQRAKTLGFALVKGLIRGLTRCPNPSLLILMCYPFLDVSYGVLTVPYCRYASM